MTGFRLARGGAQELYGITPDITCLGKIIGGGLPVGAYGGSRELMRNIAPTGPIYQAGTLSGKSTRHDGRPADVAAAEGQVDLRETRDLLGETLRRILQGGNRGRHSDYYKSSGLDVDQLLY